MAAWTEAQRRKSRQEYARYYAGGHGMNGTPVKVPENVERRETHVPCKKCGVRDGCKHRPWMLS